MPLLENSIYFTNSSKDCPPRAQSLKILAPSSFCCVENCSGKKPAASSSSEEKTLFSEKSSETDFAYFEKML